MKRLELFIPWIISCIATFGSLFFSEIRHIEPCSLCWYQRILMFPLVLILGIALIRGAYRIVYYALPFSTLGLILSSYHVYIVAFQSKASFCPECTLKAVAPYPVAFPLLSLLAFLIITASLLWCAHRHQKTKKL